MLTTDDCMSDWCNQVCSTPTTEWSKSKWASECKNNNEDDNVLIETILLFNTQATRSPLIEACIQGHLILVKLLLERGADYNLQDVVCMYR